MKICYVDESGIGKEPYAVIAGVLVDSQRMHITKQHWSDLLQRLSRHVGKPLREIHTSDFYSVNGAWRSIKGSERAEIISLIFQWLSDRKHFIVYTAVNRTEFNSGFHKKPYAKEVGTLWRLMALHICLAVQKYAQASDKIKGHTMLIFDNAKMEEDTFIKLVRNPPEWTDTYYHRDKNQDQLDQIIDVPYFGDSCNVPLIQVVDFVSFFLRKHIEIEMGASPDYEDEPSRIEG